MDPVILIYLAFAIPFFVVLAARLIFKFHLTRKGFVCGRW
jgi:hypothetical protein